MHFHWSNDNKGADHKPKGLPHKGRAWFWFGATEQYCISSEWNFGRWGLGAGIHFKDDYEDTLQVFLKLPLVQFFLGIDVPKPHFLRRLASYLCKKSNDSEFVPCNETEVSIDAYDGGLHWKFLADSHCWTSTRSRLRDGSFYPFGLKQSKSRKCLQQGVVTIILPEGTYLATATLEEVRLGYPRLPNFLDRKHYFADFKMLPRNSIPMPEKGSLREQSIAIQPSDALSNYSLQLATGLLTLNILDRRIEDGGPNWTPPKPDQALSVWN